VKLHRGNKLTGQGEPNHEQDNDPHHHRRLHQRDP
jgi:hypothetical protein